MAGAGELAAVSVELGPVVDDTAELEVVAGNSLVVNGRRLAPGVELGHTLGNRPPRDRAAEVRRWGWCSRCRALWVGAIMHSSRLIGSGMSKWLADRLRHRAIAELLHPLLKRLRAVQLARRVTVEDLDRFGNGCPRA